MKLHKVTVPVTGYHTFYVPAETEELARKAVIHKQPEVKDHGPSLDYNWLYMTINDKYITEFDPR